MGNKSKNHFDNMASSWDENPVIIKLTKAVAEKIIEVLPLDKSMGAMEFGCGTGLVTIQLAYKLGQITALDSSEKMLEELNRKVGVLEIENVSGQKVDIEQDSLPPGPFSFVFSNMTMHHIENVEPLLKEIFQRMAPGGYIAISDLDTEDGSFHGDMDGIFHYGFSRKTFVGFLENAGFVNCEIQDVHVVKKENTEGVVGEYPMFLATARKKE